MNNQARACVMRSNYTIKGAGNDMATVVVNQFELKPDSKLAFHWLVKGMVSVRTVFVICFSPGRL